jgi:hypothetical protein
MEKKKCEAGQKADKNASSNSAATDRIFGKLTAEREKRRAIETLPGEVLLHARKLRKEGKFERRIVKRAPKNMDWDTVELECGHEIRVLESSAPDAAALECSECIEARLLRNGKKTQKGKRSDRWAVRGAYAVVRRELAKVAAGGASVGVGARGRVPSHRPDRIQSFRRQSTMPNCGASRSRPAMAR